MRTRSLTALAVTGVLLLGACGTGTGGEAAAGSGGSAQVQAEQPAGEQVSLDFDSTTLAGEEFSGEALAGKPAVLWFWAPWCPTCRAQSPAVSEVSQTYAGEINVISVGSFDDVGAIRDYAKEVEGPTHLIDEAGAVWRHFGVTAQSTYVLIDAEGRMVADGFLDNEGLKEQVAKLAG